MNDKEKADAKKRQAANKKKQGSSTVQGSVTQAPDQNLVVQTQQAMRINSQGVQERDVKVVDFPRLQLPSSQPPVSGFYLCSDVSPAHLPNVQMRVLWDSGAQGTTISPECASVVLRAQAELPQDKRIAFVNMSRYDKPQQFSGLQVVRVSQ